MYDIILYLNLFIVLVPVTWLLVHLFGLTFILLISNVKLGVHMPLLLNPGIIFSGILFTPSSNESQDR